MTRPTSAKSHSSLIYHRALWATGILATLYIGMLALMRLDPETLGAASDLVSPLVGAFATLALYLAARHTPRAHVAERRAWMLMAIAQFSYTIGDCLWAYYTLVLHLEPFPSIADVFYLTFYPLAIIGLFYLPGGALVREDKIKLSLDMLIVMLASIFLFWLFILYPMLTHDSGDALTQVLTIAYPVVDLVLIFGVGQFLLSRISPQNQVPLTLLALGSIARISGDVMYLVLSVRGLYVAGEVTDWLWMIGLGLNAWAGVVKIEQARAADPATHLPVARYGQIAWVMYLPYAWVAATVFLLIWTFGVSLDPQMFWGTWIVIALVGLAFLRQIITLRENARLYQNATREIAERELAQAHLRARLGELETIYHLTDAVSRAQSLDEIHTHALDALEQTLHPDRCSILLFDANHKPGFKSRRGLSEPYRQVSVDAMHWASADQHTQPISVSDVQSDETLGALRATMLAEGIRAFAFIPLAYGDRLLGKFMLYANQPRAWHADELRLAQTIAGHITFALERWRGEEQVRASLAEKGILLKEIHHRVKNNLQIVSSLLHLQASQVQDAKIVEALRDSQNRIRSMALIHEKLYGSQDLAQIDFAEYVRNLATFLFRSYQIYADTVKLDVVADAPVRLTIDTAIPCGLIVNELISNALKHAFPQRRGGTIRVTLGKLDDGKLRLRVSDDGVGLAQTIDVAQTQSLGLQLVKTLVDQLGGTLDVTRNGGTQFTMLLPQTAA